MAINIFQGSAGKSKSVNTASQSSRATKAKQALAAPAETSNSGATAVKTGGTLSKVGNFIGKAAGIAGKFLPGLGGTISKGIANLFNDPEWWQSIPGDALTTNDMLRLLDIGELTPYAGSDDTEPNKVYNYRSAIAEGVSLKVADPSEQYVIKPTLNMITQYLMPEIRKVVNAIPLQSADNYRTVLQTQVTIYALWRQLKKVDYMLKHGTTYLPNMNVSVFPMFQVENAAWLQSTINRLEEYLRANVRLPHTMCEYLAWRFGRVYKSNASAKAGLVIYDVVSIHASIAEINSLIERLFKKISSTQELQAANTDLYNTYYDHDIMVEIRDDTQFQYDTKEFMLRTNADIGVASQYSPFTVKNNVIIDSSLDNPTTFMASTVSTQYVDEEEGSLALFPIYQFQLYTYLGDYADAGIRIVTDIATGANEFRKFGDPEFGTTSGWIQTGVQSYLAQKERQWVPASILDFLIQYVSCKSLDLYNKGLYLPLSKADGTGIGFIDATAISIDSGTVEDQIIKVEQVYAFANLVEVTRKTSTSYAKAEKLVARDTANLIDTLDVATAG